MASRSDSDQLARRVSLAPESHGCCKHSLNRPASRNAVMQDSNIEPEHFSPLDNQMRLAAKLNRRVASSVACLFGSRGPCAVAGLIVAVVFIAFNLMIERRAFAHVCVESLKAVAPSLADCDATAAVS